MKKRAHLKIIRNIVFFVLLILLTFFFIFKDQDMQKLYNVILSSNKKYIVIAIIFMFMYFTMESYNIKILLQSLGEKKVSIFSALKYTFIGFFFSAITPCSTGGQPAEIYYMTKDGNSGAKSTLVLLIQLCGFQISTILLGILCAIFNPSIITNGLIWLFLLGLLLNGSALIFMLIGIFSKKLTKKIVDFSIKLVKIFRRKNVEALSKSLYEGLNKYNDSASFIMTHKLDFVCAILRVFVQICIYYLIPFFVYKSFNLTDHSIFELFTMQAILYTTVSGIPLPGAVGISENVFLIIYGSVFGETLLSGAMLLSRGITFYLFVIISLIIVFVNGIIKKNIKGEIDEKVIEYERVESCISI